jgi:hypothetical protein
MAKMAKNAINEMFDATGHPFRAKQGVCRATNPGV